MNGLVLYRGDDELKVWRAKVPYWMPCIAVLYIEFFDTWN